MFKKTKKAQAPQVAEHTFLLCKPDAEQYHRNILQTVAEGDFRVVARSFVITPKLAEQIAKTFPSVRRSRYAEQRVGNVFPERKSGAANPGQTKTGGRLNSMLLPTSTAGDAENLSNSNDYFAEAKKDTGQPERSQLIIAEIFQLMKLRSEGGDAVNAGLTKTEGDGEPAEKNVVNDAVGSPCSPAESIDVQRGCENADTRFSSAAVLSNRILESLPYQELLEKHVNHLAFGGTCLAVELAGENAVERLLALVGPENPVEACRSAPNSIRARFGYDLVRNAVHAASNLAEAGECIAAIFGFAPHYTTAEVGEQGVSVEKPGCGGYNGYLDHGESAGLVTVRPHCELVFPGLRAPTRGPTTLEATVIVKNENPQAHISFYTGENPLGSRRRGVKCQPGGGGGGLELNAHDWQMKAKDLELQLAQQQRELAANAKLLRARELDLLLREHELENVVDALFPSVKPRQSWRVREQMQNENSGDSTRMDLFAGTATLPPVGGGGPWEGYFLPLSLGRDLEGSTEMAGRGSVLLDRPAISRIMPRIMNTQTTYDVPPVVDVDDIPLLLSRPVRLRALFMALERSTAAGKVMWSDMEGLYDRSPAIQLVWFDDHRRHFLDYLKRNTCEPLSFATFVSVLMFLFKQ